LLDYFEDLFIYNNKNRVIPNDCPNCGKKEGAIMGSSTWGHSISCCSEECGAAVSDKIKKNCDSKAYRNAVKKLEKAENFVRRLKYKNTGVDGDPFEGV
jgi:hypothetical protein